MGEAVEKFPDSGSGACWESEVSRDNVLARAPATVHLGVVGDLDGAESVEQGITLPCALMAQATLEGRRLIDSRAWRIPHGWYALHAGSRPIPSEWAQALKISWPNAPPAEALLGGVVGGLCYIEEQLTVEECQSDVWACGPVCHL